MIEKIICGPLATNTYLYIDDISGESAIVDPAYPDKKLFDAIKHQKLKYIFITHGHIDHIYAAAEIKRITGAKLVAHLLENERLKKGSENLFDTFHSLYASENIYVDDYIPVEIDMAVDTGDVITLGKTIFTVLHTPGHTNGSVSFLTEREIFCGDTLFEGSYGRTDFATGNFSEMVDTYKRLCSLDGDYIIYPGHQNTTTLRNEREFNPLRAYLYN